MTCSANDAPVTESSVQEPILQFDNVKSWDDLFDRFLSLTDEQIEELKNKNNISVFYNMENYCGSISGDTIIIIGGGWKVDFTEIVCNKLIVFNCSLTASFIYAKNVFIYGGRLSGQTGANLYGKPRLVADNAVFGTYRLVDNGTVKIVRNVMPPIDPAKVDNFSTFISKLGTFERRRDDLVFGEVSINDIHIYGTQRPLQCRVASEKWGTIEPSIDVTQLDIEELKKNIGNLSPFTLLFLFVSCCIFMRDAHTIANNSCIPDSIKNEMRAKLSTFEQLLDVFPEIRFSLCDDGKGFYKFLFKEGCVDTDRFPELERISVYW